MSGLVVITGASSGIGEACALAFARLGHPLFLGARREDRLEAVRAACEKAGSPGAEGRPLDVRSLPSIERFCKAAGAPEILLNNAGLARGREPLVEAKDEDLIEMIETNVAGLLRVTKGLLPAMVARRRGHVINIGSLAAHGVYEGGITYCATKTAVRVITQGLRLELAGTGLRVTEIDPGLVETEFSVVRLRSEEKAKEIYEGIRPLVADDIADCVVWAATRPAHVNVSEIVVTPTAQASLTKVHRG